MIGASQIRARLAGWIDERTSLAEFEDWFVPATWDIHKSDDAEAENLTNEIELSLSEYSGGYSSEEQLRMSLNRLVREGAL